MADISFPKEFLFLASFLRSFFISDFFPDGVPLINCISSSESNHISILICFISSSVQKAVEKLKVAMHHRPPALRATWWPTMPQIQLMLNRQYSYSPTSWDELALIMNARLMRVPSMRKLRLSLPNLRKIFNIVKFWKACTLERDHYFKQQRKICSLLLRKTAILITIILMRKVLKVSEFIIEN